MDPDHGAYEGKGILSWQIDLNGDRALDLGVTLMGTSGSKGEAVRSVFVNCGHEEYVTVWGPDYIFAIELPSDADKVEQQPGTWRDLIAVHRREQADREQPDRRARLWNARLHGDPGRRRDGDRRGRRRSHLDGDDHRHGPELDLQRVRQCTSTIEPRMAIANAASR